MIFFQGKSSYTRPPPLTQGGFELYDSCVDSVSKPSMFIVFERDQCYPTYLIEYDLRKPTMKIKKRVPLSSPSAESKSGNEQYFSTILNTKSVACCHPTLFFDSNSRLSPSNNQQLFPTTKTTTPAHNQVCLSSSSTTEESVSNPPTLFTLSGTATSTIKIEISSSSLSSFSLPNTQPGWFSLSSTVGTFSSNSSISSPSNGVSLSDNQFSMFSSLNITASSTNLPLSTATSSSYQSFFSFSNTTAFSGNQLNSLVPVT